MGLVKARPRTPGTVKYSSLCKVQIMSRYEAKVRPNVVSPVYFSQIYKIIF